MAGGVAGEGQEQAAEQDPAAVEQLRRQEGADEDQDRADDGQEAEREQGGLPQDRQATLAEGTAMGQRPTHFLLDREEEPGSEDEGGEPELVDRGRGVGAEAIPGERQETVRSEARHDEADGDRDRPLGHQGPEVPRQAPGRD